MISLSPRMTSLIGQTPLVTFLLVQISTIRITSFYRDLLVGGENFAAQNTIYKADPPEGNSSTTRDLYEISFGDSNKVFATAFDQGLIGRPLIVQVGFVDNATNLPELNEFLLIYRGIVESYAYNVDTKVVGEVIASVKGSNLMSSLDARSPFYTSKEFVNQISPGDTSFDQIYEGSGKVNLRWGKRY